MKTSPDTSLPAGYTMRPVAYEDKSDCLEMLNVWSGHRFGVAKFTPANVDWHVPGLDIQTSFRVVDNAHGKMVGYAEVWDVDSPPVDVWLWARVHPDYEGMGIGSAMLNSKIRCRNCKLQMRLKESCLRPFAHLPLRRFLFFKGLLSCLFRGRSTAIVRC